MPLPPSQRQARSMTSTTLGDNPLVLDTSVLVRLNKQPIHDAYNALASHAVFRCVISDLEVGFSARNVAEWDAFATVLSFCDVLDVHPSAYRRALTVQRTLAEHGLRGRKIADLLIAAAAEQAGATVVHYDHDFELIAGVTGQPHAWIVPPGTAD